MPLLEVSVENNNRLHFLSVVYSGYLVGFCQCIGWLLFFALAFPPAGLIEELGYFYCHQVYKKCMVSCLFSRPLSGLCHLRYYPPYDILRYDTGCPREYDKLCQIAERELW